MKKTLFLLAFAGALVFSSCSKTVDENTTDVTGTGDTPDLDEDYPDDVENDTRDTGTADTVGI